MSELYNLLISGSEDSWETNSYIIDADRFLEYTDKDLKERFLKLDKEQIDEIKSLPCIFAYEDFSDKTEGFIGYITDITKRQGKIKITYDKVETIALEDMHKLKFELDISEWEFRRTHWAIKKVDLNKELQVLGLSLKTNQPVDITENNIDVAVTFAGETRSFYPLKQIGNGSYANVYKYKDTFYNKNFVLKRAKKDLSEKEIKRFKREFEEMQDFSSPYIVEVYCYNENQNEYIMEYMDFTLESYITKHNSSLSIVQRKSIIQQILRAFEYIHSKGRLHRDISPKNILIKPYEDIIVVKVADFGLVKISESALTAANTEFKGYFNDPSLILDGFDTYSILHETFALTRVVYYVMTGRTNVDTISDPKLKTFINKGLNPAKSQRFQTISEMALAFKLIG
ncbi:protein kinase family protein [Sporomusa malonica]|uniref:Protein kinase domain-containing protein n=1 Tax=Sporomusa malonica TaxID=112901 RepID=A0A1W2F5L0_9FIRM|nr:protein kinase family protein [Sporomusa malonica]SMD17230.1 Protein kinase domain-containing protein [Sporomusa malonica]